MDPAGYSVANAERFGWTSLGDDPDPGRRRLLDDNLRGPRILEVGCAGGGYVRHLQAEGHDVVGLDLHVDFLRLAAATRAGPYVCSDAASLPFGDGAFTTSFSFDVLEHVEDDVRVLREMARTTTDRLLLAVPAEDTPYRRFGLTLPPYQDPTHVRYYTEETLTRAIHLAIPTARVRVLPELPIRLKPMLHSLVAQQAATGPGRGRVLRRRLSNAALRLVQLPDMHIGLQAIVELGGDGQHGR